MKEQTTEVEKLRIQNTTVKSLTKKCSSLEERLEQERKVSREGIQETETLLQQKAIKVLELSSRIEGLFYSITSKL